MSSVSDNANEASGSPDSNMNVSTPMSGDEALWILEDLSRNDGTDDDLVERCRQDFLKRQREFANNGTSPAIK